MKKIDEQDCFSMPTLGFSPDAMARWAFPEHLQSATYFPEFVSTFGEQAFAAHWGCFNAENYESAEPDGARDAFAGENVFAALALVVARTRDRQVPRLALVSRLG
jgi:hypothetical protein